MTTTEIRIINLPTLLLHSLRALVRRVVAYFVNERRQQQQQQHVLRFNFPPAEPNSLWHWQLSD